MNPPTSNTQHLTSDAQFSLNHSRLALLMHDNISGRFGKMGLGLLRYSEAAIPP